MAVDASGNVYVVRVQYDIDANFNGSHSNVIAKYTTGGTLLWKHTLTVGIPRGVAVSSNGNVYVAGLSGVARYTNSGNLSWTLAGATTAIATSGTNIVYARNLNTIRKLDATEKQL